MRQAVQPDTIERRLQVLEADADARRARISNDLDELSWRMQPANLLKEARDSLMREVDRATDALADMAGDLVDDTVGFVRNHAPAIGAGTALALLTGAGIWLASRHWRKDPVPLYDAYNMEDFNMHDSDDSLRQRAAGTWTKVKDDAKAAGHKAGESYYAARSRAAVLSAEARGRAGHAADTVRERASDAVASARDASEAAGEWARDASEAAGEWARKRPQENPLTTVAAVLAVGLVAGLMLPSRRS